MKKLLILTIILFLGLPVHEIQSKKPENNGVKIIKSVKPTGQKDLPSDMLSAEDANETDFLEALLKDLSKQETKEESNSEKNKKNGFDFIKLLKEIEEDQKREEAEAKAKKKKETAESGAATAKAFSVVEPAQIKETLDSVILNDDNKKELDLIIKYFKTPEIFKEIGAERPRGILLEGPPGTGKTSIGRALAKEAGCKFFYANGSDFDAKFVGEGAKAISELFKTARENSPSIIFIDEIDTIAKKRTSEESRFHSQTAIKLLTEMDGFIQSEEAVIVIATTNKKDHLDTAILRGGRFSRHMKIGNPDGESRKKILSLYTSKVKLSPNVKPFEINELAVKAEGFSGADLKNMAQQAAINALMNNKNVVEYIDLEKSFKQIKDQKKSEKQANRKNPIPDYAQSAMMNDRFA